MASVTAKPLSKPVNPWFIKESSVVRCFLIYYSAASVVSVSAVVVVSDEVSASEAVSSEVSLSVSSASDAVAVLLFSK